MRSLLLAPFVVLLLGHRVFAGRLALRPLLPWFACGFFALLFVGVLTRWLTPKRIIIRRKEP
jgi:hypothetical protein